MAAQEDNRRTAPEFLKSTRKDSHSHMREIYLTVRFIEMLAAFLIVIGACKALYQWLRRN